MRLRLFPALSLAALASLAASGAQAAVLMSLGTPAGGSGAVDATAGAAFQLTASGNAISSGGPAATIGVGGQNLSAAVPTPPIILVPQGLPAILVPPGITAVPEPASWALMLVGFGGLGGMLRRRRQARAA